ncbi:1147_t:CDS:2, partial [Gigaspora margarita]
YQVSDGCQIPDLTLQKSEETIGDMAQWILQDKLSIRDIKAEAHALANSAPNANAELKNLGASFQIIEATKFSDITEEANKIQRDNWKKAEANCIDYPDHFTLESVRERLDGYNISTSPDLQALADVMIILLTGYTKNRGQPDISRKFRSMEKDWKRAKELLTWIQNDISSGRMGDP